MAKLILPNKHKHKFVIGIDFGHGETSAAICELEWGKAAGLKNDSVMDLDMDRGARKKVIPSAICRTNEGITIGAEAFEHTFDNDGLRISFKQKPSSIEGDAEQLMIDYMKSVYGRIRQYSPNLTDDNHIVYIARPSGWVEEDAKELYRNMALQAGIPLAGLTSESRAAIFYAKSPKVNFSNAISQGAIVFDLGSSTLDFTYLSDSSEPIDFGYDLGASLIDNAIFEKMMLSNIELASFLQDHPEYEDAIKFEARKFKESVFSRSATSRTIIPFSLASIIPMDDDDMMDKYGFISFNLMCKNLQEINDMIESSCAYLSRLKDALIDFRENHIPGKIINGVFLTGGASRMNFIIPIIADVLGMSEDVIRVDDDNPSLTISRGIALLGSVDATTVELVSELKKNIPIYFTSEKIIKDVASSLSRDVAQKAWNRIESICNTWIECGKTTDRDELKEKLESGMKEFQTRQIKSIINESVKNYVTKESEDIRKKMNKIISLYAPGREITISGTLAVENCNALDKCIKDLTANLQDLAELGLGDILGEIFWKVLAYVLVGVFALPYYVLMYIFTDDKDRRKDKASAILNKKVEITREVELQMNIAISQNREFGTTISKSIAKYFEVLIDSNLQKVIVPIE